MGRSRSPTRPCKRHATQKPKRLNSPPPSVNSAQPSRGSRARPATNNSRTTQPANRTRTAPVAQVRIELSVQDLQRMLVERYPTRWAEDHEKGRP